MAKIALAIEQASDTIGEIDRAYEQRCEDIEVINQVVIKMDEVTQTVLLPWSQLRRKRIRSMSGQPT